MSDRTDGRVRERLGAQQVTPGQSHQFSLSKEGGVGWMVTACDPFVDQKLMLAGSVSCQPCNLISISLTICITCLCFMFLSFDSLM